MAEFDPDNPTFYGESWSIREAFNVTGAAITDEGAAMQWLYDDDLSQRLVEGQSILATLTAVGMYLTPSDPAVLSWVVETADDSAGSVNFKAGRDAGWPLDPKRATEDLGTVTVSGRQTIVLRQTVFTAADVFAPDGPAPTLLVRPVAGSVSIRQIRLRVWPPNGPTGQWVSAPGFTQTGSARRLLAHSLELQTSTTHPDNHVPAWKEMTGSIITLDQQDVAWETNPDRVDTKWTWMRLGWDDGMISEEPGWRADGFLHPVRLTWERRPVIPGQFPHPDVVPGESVAWGIVPGGGTILPTFKEWSGPINVRVTGELEGWYGISIPPNELQPDPEFPGRFHGMYAPPPYLSSYQVTGTAPPAIPDVILTPVPGEFFSNPPPPAVNATYEADLATAPFAIETVPDHLIFNPALPWDDGPKPRFFWKDELDQWRAIGPGKPVDDPVLLRIKTAMGHYREPRHGEDPAGSGAHPLKVKTAEGYGPDSWDTPVWMTPLD